MMAKKFEGVMTALVTPFLKGEIDFKSIKKLIRHQLDHGIEGFVVAGSTGEAATLTLEEKMRLLDFIISETAGHVPIVMGSGTFNTSETCELCRRFTRPGVDGLLVVTPYYNRPPQRGLEAHFVAVAGSTPLPILIYNVPGRTASDIAPSTVAAIAGRAKNVVGIKEAAGKLETFAELKQKCPPGFVLLSGDDGTFLRSMELGGQGVISVVSHVIPRFCVDASKKAAAKKDVTKLSDQMAELTALLFCESNPIPVKWALKKMGILESGELRLPLVELAAEHHEKLSKAMEKMGALS